MAEYLLLLDTGDALVAPEGSQGQVRGADVVAGMNLMGYDAMAIGPMELGLGTETLRQRLSEADFPMLSANVRWRSDQALVGEPYVVLQVSSVRIGVIGLTRNPGEEFADFEVLEPHDVLAQLVPEVEMEADTVVLLTNLPYRSALELAEAVPGIDLVIAALPRQLPEVPARIPQTGTIAVTAEQALQNHSGRRVGRLVVVVAGDGTLSGEVWESRSMGPEFADDPEMKALLDEFRAQ